jgi:hypothetical protein
MTSRDSIREPWSGEFDLKIELVVLSGDVKNR